MSNPPDKPGSGDVAQIIGKALVSVVPLAGGPLAELVDLLRIPAQKRQHAWLTDLAERLRQLEDNGRLKPEDLASSEAFLTATLRAAQAAVRTGETEKREALRNVVLNVALAPAPDEAQIQIFLDLLDRFTGWHLKLLKAFQDPAAWARTHNVQYRPAVTSSSADFLEAAFPELQGRRDFYDQLWEDLTQCGFVKAQITGMMTEKGWEARRITKLADAFLAFIEAPVLDSAP